MPLSRDELCHAIINRLHYLAMVLQVRTLWRLSDTETPLDGALTALFNTLFAGRFTALQQHKPDCPVDLGEPSQRMAVLVTNQGTSARVLDAHEQVIKHGLGREYDRVILLFLRPHKPVLSRRIRKTSVAPVIDLWDLGDVLEKLGEIDDIHALHVALEALRSQVMRLGPVAKYPTSTWRLFPSNNTMVGNQVSRHAVKELMHKHRLVAIAGSAGRGKTTLAYAVLAELGPPAGYHGPCPRRLLRHHFGHLPGYDTALFCLLSQAGRQPQGMSLEEMEALARPVLTDPATYVWLEGGEHAFELSRLLDLATGAHILLTTRDATVPKSLACFALPNLAIADAAKRVAMVSTDGVLTTPSAAHLDVARFLDGHALACTLAGHILNHTGWAASRMVGQLKSSGLESLSDHQREQANAFHLLDHLWKLALASQPGSGSVCVLLALGSLAPLPGSHLMKCSGLAWHALHPLLETLQDLGLVRSEKQAALPTDESQTLWSLSHDRVREYVLHPASPAHGLVRALYPQWRDTWLVLLEESWATRTLPGGPRSFEGLQPHFAALLEQIQELDGATPDLYPLALTHVAVLSHRQGRLCEAATLYKQSFAWCQANLGASHATTLNAANNLAVLLHSQGERAQAEQLYRQVLVGQERTLGPEHPDTLGSLNNLATVRLEQGQHREAEDLYRRVLEALHRTLGAEHPDTITCLGNLASLLRNHGQPGKAERLYRQLLALKERTLGTDHPDTQHSLRILAGLLHRNGDLVSAETLFRRSLATWERLHGPDHLRTLTAANDLGMVLEAQGHPAEAVSLYERATSGARSQLPPQDARRLKFEQNHARLSS